MTAVRRLAAVALATTVLASASSAWAQTPETTLRLGTLEQQVRELNGRIEEMNFLVLQLQEELRKQKEDNEFRFQDLEGGAAPEQRGDVAPTDGDREVADLDRDSARPQPGSPPRTLGEVPAEGDDLTGDIVTGSLNLDADFASDTALAAAVGRAKTPETLYETGYDFALAGEYGRAEQVFRLHRRRFPDAENGAQATYWLGESLIALDRPEEAAEVLLDGHETFEDSAWAPDMLMKVGVAMGLLGNDDIACATFSEVDRLYPMLPLRTATTLSRERAEVGC